MTRPVVACVSMDEHSHVQGVLLMAEGLVRAGAACTVFTHTRHAGPVRAVGATFADLFAEGPLEAVDGESRPVPVRFVTFAAERAGALAARLAALGTQLVVHDTFATVGAVAARRLGLPAVNLSGGHALVPATYAARLARDPRVEVSAACERAVVQLRDVDGIPGASPFLYVTGTSAVRNLLPQPPPWLTAPARQAFEPADFVGALPRRALELAAGRRPRPAGPVRVHVGLGTTVWRYHRDQALATLGAVAEAARTTGFAVSAGLGGHDPGHEALDALRRAGVTVDHFADQPARLAAADLFITHHGLRSTHEAVHARVPMLSAPFFWDQPDLAARSVELGVAHPLTDDASARPPDADAVRAGVDAVLDQWEHFQDGLERAWDWEAQVLRDRPRALGEVLALARTGP